MGMKGQSCITRQVCYPDDFSYDEELGIYVGPSGTGDSGRDEEDVEYIGWALKRAKDLSAYSPELKSYIMDWPSRYHLSAARNHVLESVAELFDSNSTVLEVGAGCGAITRWLGERFREVDSVEGSLQRAVVARARTSGMDNVRVYSGDISKASLNKKYDVVTLIGKLADAPLLYGPAPCPAAACMRMLGQLGDALRDNGILAVAIENKLGARYLLGGHEEHTGKRFMGLQGYAEHSPVTFSRNELEDIIKRSGFDNVQFYHLFPDYRLASTILRESEETLALKPYNWIQALQAQFEDHYSAREYTLIEPLFLKTITEAGMLWQLSNSFLALASRSRDVNLESGWYIKKFNFESHGGEFKHQIALEKEGPRYMVKRTPVQGNGFFVNARGVEFGLEDEEYVRGELLSMRLYRALLEDDRKAGIVQAMKVLHEGLLAGYSAGKHDLDGYPMVRGNAVDYTFWNVIAAEDGSLRFIDRKWRMGSDIPADFVLFRNLFHVYRVIYPFVKERSLPAFIMDIIGALYPGYTRGRLKYDARLEEALQSAIAGKRVSLYMGYPAWAIKMGIALRKSKGTLVKVVKQKVGARRATTPP